MARGGDIDGAPPGWRAWLPESALAQGGVDQTIADVARHWSTKWLARKNLRPLGTLTSVRSVRADEKLRWLVLDDDLALGVSAAASDRLATLMLGETGSDLSPTAEDQRILHMLTDGAVEDLCRRVAEALGFSPETRWLECAIGEPHSIAAPRSCQLGVDAATPLFHVALSEGVLVARAKMRAARAGVRDQVQPIAIGLAAQSVSVSASLGRCALTLADFAGLGVGDVLLLDRTVDAALPVALDGVAAIRGTCTVQQGGDRLDLKLLESLAS